jgi:hypothetical protein
MFVKTPATQTHSEFGRASTGLPSTRYSGPPLDHKVVFEHGRTDLGMNLPYDSSLLWFVRQTPPAKFLSHAVRATLALSPLLSSYPLPSFLSLSLIIFSFCSLPSFPSSSTTPTSAQHPSLKPKTTDPTPHASLVSPNHKPQTTNLCRIAESSLQMPLPEGWVEEDGIFVNGELDITSEERPQNVVCR